MAALPRHLRFDPPSELVALSARLGGDPLLVQGGGGNTSFKRDDDFWIKASGTWLAHAGAQDIFVRLSLREARAAIVGDDAENALTALALAGGLRPSIETSLHALLPHAVVAHVHSVNAIAWAARTDAESALTRALQGEAWTWVPYRRPGLPLTDAIRDALDAATTTPDALLLGNHGLVVGGADCAEAEARLREIEARLALPARAPIAPDRARLAAANDLGWIAPDHALPHAIGTDPVVRAIALRGALYPDHVVFLGERAIRVDDRQSLSSALSATVRDGGATASFAVVPGAGLLHAPELGEGARAMLDCLAEVGLRCDSADALRYLALDEVAALIGWEAEAYRRARERADATAAS
ncbi:MAG: class II aldolase/adducin family protein [Pseudomonadota bacterium]